jgi:hypothetical protein
MVLPGPTLKQEIFSLLTPAEVEERLQFPDESEGNPQSRQVFFGRDKSEKVEVPEHSLGEAANIGSTRLTDHRDDQLTGETESEVEDEGDNMESRVGDGDAGPEGNKRGEEFRRNVADEHESDSDSEEPGDPNPEEPSNSNAEEPNDLAQDASNDSENEGPSNSASEESSDEGDGSEYVDSGPPSSDSG